ncbi:MAG: hypothetical protein HQL90_14275 [Magnetococcales bacterium]|nr:hypothetical protein [Magnetococcales bacterium]
MEKQETDCFSRVEVAIVLIVAGLVVTTLVASRDVAHTAKVRTAYQQLVVPCVAALHAALHQQATTAQATYPETELDGIPLNCQFDATTPNGVINRVTINGAPETLQTMIQQNLANERTQVTGPTITLPPPTDASTAR